MPLADSRLPLFTELTANLPPIAFQNKVAANF
jgi:hypothetical protein